MARDLATRALCILSRLPSLALPVIPIAAAEPPNNIKHADVSFCFQNLPVIFACRSRFRSLFHDSTTTYSRRQVFHAKSHPALDLSCQQVVTSRDLCSQHVNSPYPHRVASVMGGAWRRACCPGWSERRRALPISGNRFRTAVLLFKIRNESAVRWDECATIKLKIDTQKEHEIFFDSGFFSFLQMIVKKKKKLHPTTVS